MLTYHFLVRFQNISLTIAKSHRASKEASGAIPTYILKLSYLANPVSPAGNNLNPNSGSIKCLHRLLGQLAVHAIIIVQGRFLQTVQPCRPVPQHVPLHPIPLGAGREHCFIITPLLLLRRAAGQHQSFGRAGSPRGSAASFHEEERLVPSADRAFNPVQLLLPLIDRIIAAGGDDIYRIPPAHALLLIFIAVIRHQPAINASYTGNQGPPLHVRLSACTISQPTHSISQCSSSAISA